jgi:hypothetical protein
VVGTEAWVTIVGPTVGMLPDAFLARGADILGCVRVTMLDAFSTSWPRVARGTTFSAAPQRSWCWRAARGELVAKVLKRRAARSRAITARKVDGRDEPVPTRIAVERRDPPFAIFTKINPCLPRLSSIQFNSRRYSPPALLPNRSSLEAAP